MANAHGPSSVPSNRPIVSPGLVALLQQKSPLCFAAGVAIYAAGLAHVFGVLQQCLG